MDLPASIKPHNLITLLASGAKNLGLTTYLVKEVLKSKEKNIEELRQFVPTAKSEDWELIVAGQRVQVIKDTPEAKGILQFGTEVITSQDGSVAALLGASPGASTAVHVMLQVIAKCYPEKMGEWAPKLKEMIPSYGEKLLDNLELLAQVKESSYKTLQVK